MIFSTALRTALSCEPNIISILSESISLTALLETSAGGAPASANTISTWRPRMPPFVLMVAAPSSAAARCAGPNSAAGPESAISTPIFIVSAANAVRTTDGAPMASAPKLAARSQLRRLVLIEVSIFPLPVGIEFNQRNLEVMACAAPETPPPSQALDRVSHGRHQRDRRRPGRPAVRQRSLPPEW